MGESMSVAEERCSRHYIVPVKAETHSHRE